MARVALAKLAITENKTMKIILASDISFLLKYGYDLTGIPKNQMKIGYVITASKGARTNVNQKYRTALKNEGYPIEEIDIEGKSQEELKKFFEDKNIIQVEGGNSFYLLRAIRATGFDKIIKELIDAGKIYIGMSAGSYVMCPSIEVSDWNKDGRDRFGVTDFTALNYVPFILKVHYTDEMKSLVKEKMATLKCPLRILRDGQGILVEDDKYTFFGDEEETKLL